MKAREAQGYAYDTAQASFELVARAELGRLATPFEVERYRVTVERRRNARGQVISHSEAVVAVRIGDARMMSVSESVDETGSDAGPVNALAQALVKDLGPLQAAIADMRLVDFKVRITDGGTEAVTRVIIDSADAGGRRWSTVGVSANIIDASFEALLDAITWKLIRDGAGRDAGSGRDAGDGRDARSGQGVVVTAPAVSGPGSGLGSPAAGGLAVAAGTSATARSASALGSRAAPEPEGGAEGALGDGTPAGVGRAPSPGPGIEAGTDASAPVAAPARARS